MARISDPVFPAFRPLTASARAASANRGSASCRRHRERLAREPVRPLEADAAKERGRALHVARLDVERAADADSDAAAGRREVPREPELLLRRPEAGKQHVGAACTNRVGDRAALALGEVAVARAGDSRARVAAHERVRRAARGITAAAEQIQAHVAGGRRPGCKRVDQLDAGDALAQRAAAELRCEQQSDGVARDERGAVDRAAERVVATRRHHHLDAERYDDGGAAGIRERRDLLDGLVAPDRVDTAAEDGEAGVSAQPSAARTARSAARASL